MQIPEVDEFGLPHMDTPVRKQVHQLILSQKEKQAEKELELN